MEKNEINTTDFNEHKELRNNILNAINENDVNKLLALIDEHQYEIGKTVKYIDEYGENILFKACRDGNLNIVQTLINNGANPYVKNKEGKDITDYNIKENIKQIVIEAQKAGSYNQAATAIRNKNYYNLSNVLLKYGDEILTHNENTAFRLDITKTKDDLALQIIEDSGLGAKIRKANKSIPAQETKKVEISKEEKERQQKLEIYTNELLGAFRSGDELLVEELIKREPENFKKAVNTRGDSNENPFFIACRGNNENIVKMCLDNGADPFLRNKFNKEILDCNVDKNIQTIITAKQKQTIHDKSLSLMENKDYFELSNVLSRYQSYLLEVSENSNSELNILVEARKKNDTIAEGILNSSGIGAKLDHLDKSVNFMNKLKKETNLMEKIKEINSKPTEKEIEEMEQIQEQEREREFREMMAKTEHVKQNSSNIKKKESIIVRFFKKVFGINSSRQSTNVPTSIPRQTTQTTQTIKPKQQLSNHTNKTATHNQTRNENTTKTPRVENTRVETPRVESTRVENTRTSTTDRGNTRIGTLNTNGPRSENPNKGNQAINMNQEFAKKHPRVHKLLIAEIDSLRGQGHSNDEIKSTLQSFVCALVDEPSMQTSTSKNREVASF